MSGWRGRGWWCVLGLLALWPAGAGVRELKERGIYRVDVRAGKVTYVGPYRYPSVDTDSQLLYGDDGQGAIVTWPLGVPAGKPKVFLTTPPGEAKRAVPLAAPTGGKVALTRLMGERGQLRVTLEVYARDGRRVVGPLPLFAANSCWNRNLVAAWHPEGDLLAFSVAAGKPRPGLYVMRTYNRNWVQATAFGDAIPSPLPICRWQPDGRALSVVLDGQLQLRAGGAYAVLSSWATSGWLHSWLDIEHPVTCDPTAGMTVYNLDGKVRSSLPIWKAPRADLLSVPVCNEQGSAWVGPTPGVAGQSSLFFMAKDQVAAVEVLRFTAGRQPYGRQSGGPVWQGDEPLLFFDVP